MKINRIKIKNFRGYQNETTVSLGNLTAFVGKNDIGKSTVLEALDIFFNMGKTCGKLDKDDVNKSAREAGDLETIISVVFEELPENVIIDAANTTSLANEYLLNSEGHLEVVKKYTNAGKEKVFIKAYHPTNPYCAELLLKTNSQLKALLNDQIECADQTRNAVIRTSLWNHFSDDLQLQSIEIDVTKSDAKSIWEKLHTYLPLYSLFQSDRKNSDGDSEVQDPMKEAVKQILSDGSLVNKLTEVAQEVQTKLEEVAAGTLEKLNEMNPEIANSLNPRIPSAETLKWVDVFKSVSIAGDEDIPINKRGSGVKRLILINFFRAEAQRLRNERNNPSIIYAIEEPETSQHAEHQKLLIEALKELSGNDNTQILMTTHGAFIVKSLEFDQLRLIEKNDGIRSIHNVAPHPLPRPSLNEVNYTAFNEITEEYHNELYGYIESEGWLGNYRNGRPTVNYVREFQNGNTQNQQIIRSEFIRHQIHHPENVQNVRFTRDQLEQSIIDMRTFIEAQP